MIIKRWIECRRSVVGSKGVTEEMTVQAASLPGKKKRQRDVSKGKGRWTTG